MKTFLPLILILVATSSVTLAQTSEKVPGNKVEQEILRREDERRAAIVRSDRAVLENIFADDYSVTSAFGLVRDKAQILADYKSGALKYEQMSDADVRVRVYGDAAVVTGLTTSKGKDRGREVTGQRRFIRVWIRQSGQWRLVANQSTLIP